MYSINKLVGFVASPIGCAIIGGFIPLMCIWIRHHCLAKWIGWLTIAWLWLWMTPVMTWVVGVPLEREFLEEGRVPEVEKFPEVDAIVLLGGGMGMDTNLSSYAEMWTSADRVWQAVRLYKAGKATKIIATGNYAKDTTLPLLIDFGVPEDAVSFLDARTTEEEARGLWDAFQRSGAETQISQFGVKPKILLVTSAWHMKRARLMFEKYASGVDVVCAPADFENTIMAQKISFPQAFLPDHNVFQLNSVAFHELVGIVGYAVFR